MFNLFSRERIRQAERFLKRQHGTYLCVLHMQREFPVIKKRACTILCMNQGGNAGKARSLFRTRFLYFLEGGRLTMAKEQVQAITKMEEDFAQWYTDIVKKQNLLIIQV